VNGREKIVLMINDIQHDGGCSIIAGLLLVHVHVPMFSSTIRIH